MLKVVKNLKNKNENILKDGKVYFLSKSSKYKELFNSLPEGTVFKYYMINIVKKAEKFAIFDIKDNYVLKDGELTEKGGETFEFGGKIQITNDMGEAFIKEGIKNTFYVEAGKKLSPSGFVKTYEKMEDIIPSQEPLKYDREVLEEIANSKIQEMMKKGFILVDVEGTGVRKDLLGKSVTIWFDFEGSAIGLFAPKDLKDEIDALESQKTNLARTMWYEIANEIGEDALLKKAHAYRKRDGGFYTSVDVCESEDGYRASRSFEKRLSVEDVVRRAAGAEFDSRKKAIEEQIKGMATEKVVLIDNLKLK